MNCPQCKGYQLEPMEIEMGLVAASCPKCAGVLLPLMNYRYWLDTAEVSPDGSENQLQGDLVVDDSAQAKLCPKCSKLMTKFRMGSDTENRIELCSGCDEAWLDKGEWNLLKALDLQDNLPRIFTEAWQRNIRLQRQSQNQMQYYEKVLGAKDLEKVVEFKSWLDQHAERGSIMHVLSTKFDNLS